jgi:dTMP kinase
MKGLFIAFEGPDGCGKSTQIRFLAEYLTSLGLSVVCTREPGGSPVAEKIREIVLSRENTGMAALTEALLYAAARAEHVRKVIAPALDAGKVVLCDRFV